MNLGCFAIIYKNNNQMQGLLCRETVCPTFKWLQILGLHNELQSQEMNETAGHFHRVIKRITLYIIECTLTNRRPFL